MCSSRGPHARDQIARLGSVHLLEGRVTDTREKELPLPIYDLKVEGRNNSANYRIYGFKATGEAIPDPERRQGTFGHSLRRRAESSLDPAWVMESFPYRF
ncbi:hypothetical protein CRG98_004424 [Punica granatum]|uniref:Uncharacterized protein n=1 Tax=Punica granatum TaxID=22663 RepID=A0A2I0L3K3_PUNGR|nr:hypothetical protein CRG98_004424 [Punica granatum]